MSYYLVRSHHLPIFVGNSASCAVCYTGAVGTSLVKLWLGTPCGLSPLIDSRASRHKPQRLSTRREVWVGGALLHPSHTLFSLRGLVYCSVCGFVAGHKARKLREICGAGLATCPTPRGRDNLQRLLGGLLPRSTPVWPMDFVHPSEQPWIAL